MKTVEINDGEELTDFTVEIDILSELQHPNIVKMLEAFFFQEKLFVSAPSLVHGWTCSHSELSMCACMCYVVGTSASACVDCGVGALPFSAIVPHSCSLSSALVEQWTTYLWVS